MTDDIKLPESMAPTIEAIVFGAGAVIVNTGTIGDKPAVFIDAAHERGQVGAPAPDVPAGTIPLACLLFPTIEQAERVADALVNAQESTALISELCEALDGLLDALPSATTHPAIKAARAALLKARGEG